MVPKFLTYFNFRFNLLKKNQLIKSFVEMIIKIKVEESVTISIVNLDVQICLANVSIFLFIIKTNKNYSFYFYSLLKNYTRTIIIVSSFCVILKS